MDIDKLLLQAEKTHSPVGAALMRWKQAIHEGDPEVNTVFGAIVLRIGDFSVIHPVGWTPTLPPMCGQWRRLSLKDWLEALRNDLYNTRNVPRYSKHILLGESEAMVRENLDTTVSITSWSPPLSGCILKYLGHVLPPHFDVDIRDDFEASTFGGIGPWDFKWLTGVHIYGPCFTISYITITMAITGESLWIIFDAGWPNLQQYMGATATDRRDVIWLLNNLTGRRIALMSQGNRIRTEPGQIYIIMSQERCVLAARHHLGPGTLPHAYSLLEKVADYIVRRLTPNEGLVEDSGIASAVQQECAVWADYLRRDYPNPPSSAWESCLGTELSQGYARTSESGINVDPAHVIIPKQSYHPQIMRANKYRSGIEELVEIRKPV